MKRRIIRLIFSFLVIYTLNFFIPRCIPGDPFSHSSSISGDEMNGLNEEEILKMKEYYGLDKPLPQQFLKTIADNLNGNLGNSILYKKPVSEVIVQRAPWTLFLMVTSLILSLISGVLLSIISIFNKRIGDIIYRFMILICEIPPFVLGIILLFLGPAKISWIPLSGALTPFMQYSSKGELILDILKHAIMPILTLVLINTPGFYFTAKTSFERNMDKTYVKTARARGVSKISIILRYIFLNSWTAIMSKFFLSIGNVLGGTIVVENVFAYPGIGQTMKDAIINRDFILIQGIFLMSTLIVLTSSFISDVLVDRMTMFD